MPLSQAARAQAKEELQKELQNLPQEEMTVQELDRRWQREVKRLQVLDKKLLQARLENTVARQRAENAKLWEQQTQ